ncbi:hypothetical protein QBC33DRAFT_584371 [Phialemonium atrogriseum]|uniref:Uncharacterized protein n=1 Tax=Phialemonium atrogriseum TaxID=1093897 RepID=A0AAJ0FM51_9PEZI|nr:uncharacterized protein QBC33DRAFT_584371 [Phialemonium atrogriseum]KAK1772887.1 hypothetical protein QBC33DRAFT_584371 [Phialemonium atrogriseum]
MSISSPSSGSAHTASSPAPFLSICDQTFTPLSMDSSDLDLMDERDRDRDRDGDACAAEPRKAENTCMPALQVAEDDGGNRQFAPKASADRTKDTDIASSMVQSPPGPCSATAAPPAEYDLASTKNITSSEYHPPTPYFLAHSQSRSSPSQPRDATATSRPIRTTTAAATATAVAIATTAATTILRPKPKAPPRNTNTQQQPATTSSVIPEATTEPALVRRVSNASVTIRHPAPDLNTRSGAYLGNIAALEATAERLSMTSSIEDAIRDAHDELKRSDSQRSSILRANRASRAASDAGSTSGLPHLTVLSRQSSILSTNNAARLGGYSPAGYVMSPNHSLSNASSRLRSGSKASSSGAPPPATEIMDYLTLSPDIGSGEDLGFMSRHGPGKSSVRSVVSAKLPLAEIAEMEPPMTLTQDALDEADRAAEAHEDTTDEDATIRASAFQYIDIDVGLGLGRALELDDIDAAADAQEVMQPMLPSDYMGLPSPNRLQLHQPDSYVHYGNFEHERPTTAESGMTLEQAETAFGDFDGVHCDPEVLDFPEPLPRKPSPRQTPRAPQPPRAPAPRPTSYFDAATGQQMLFYPARVPAMLNLPPKLSKNSVPTARKKVRSQILSAMPTESRESRVWLPDPLESLGDMGSPLMGEESSGHDPAGLVSPGDIPSPEIVPKPDQLLAGHSRHPSETGTIVPSDSQKRDIQRQSRMMESENRKSHMPVSGDLAPQLRASVYFDLPPEAPIIEVKDGSATATLDSILNASAIAPVSAFVDHTFAGKLGAEVYGREKKAKKKGKEPASMGHKRGGSGVTMLGVAEPKKRASILSLMVGGRQNSETLDVDVDGRRTALGVAGEGGIRRVSSDGSSATGHDQPLTSPGQPLPREENEKPEEEDGKEEQDEDDEDDDEDDDQYQGPPTTLLAELQLRKQQQKLRTRPVHKVYPNGLHSTLLELDTVAEVERKQRKGKRVNLAWEDPTANPDPVEDENDDDVPLGMLYAAKAAAAANGGNRSTVDISAVMSEIHRPLGLMERRDMEENEPLSRRRDRLQGRDLGSSLNLNTLQKRMSMMTLTQGGLGARTQSRLMLPLQQQESLSVAGDDALGAEADPEIEGETLAERRRRLNAETLPRARPVSGAFSAELLGQFDDLDEDEAGADPKGKGRERIPTKSPDQDKEADEETLGQRRRRLQAEREAREREMGPGGNPIARSRTPLSRPMSMANILGAHPLDGGGAQQQRVVQQDPREQQRQRVEAEAARAQRERDAQMAAMRAQMPQYLTGPAVGAANGGYMSGRFNDGLGGGVGSGQSLVYGPGAAQQRMAMYSGAAGYGVGPAGSANMAPASAYGVPMGNPAAYGGGVPMGAGAYGMNGPYNGVGPLQMPPTQGQLDMVERWRQSVMP